MLESVKFWPAGPVMNEILAKVKTMTIRQGLARKLGVLLGCMLLITGGAEAALSKADQNDIARIEAYLNASSTVKARFTQTNPDGSVVEGTAYLSRPGKLRLEYEPPVPVLVVADGQFLIYYDKELKQASWLGLDETPAGILVRPNVSLNGKTVTVQNVTRSRDTISLRMVQTATPELGEMTMTFDSEPLALREWQIKDQEGKITTVVLSDIETGMSLSADLFVFEDPNYSDPLASGRGRKR